LEEHPRFATTFFSKVKSGIDPDLLGTSTLTWWDKVIFTVGKLNNTKPLYK
jgi:hypothetical protein